MLKKSWIWWRFVRLKVSYWFSLGRALYKFLISRDQDRDRYQMHLVMAIARFNILSIYELLDDLIRFPPY